MLVSEADANGAGGGHQFAGGINGFHFSDRVGDVHRANGFLLQANHFAELAGGDQVYGSNSKASGEDAVVGRWRTSALDVAENADAHFLVGKQADGVANQVSVTNNLAASAGGSVSFISRIR